MNSTSCLALGASSPVSRSNQNPLLYGHSPWRCYKRAYARMGSIRHDRVLEAKIRRDESAQAQ